MYCNCLFGMTIMSNCEISASGLPGFSIGRVLTHTFRFLNTHDKMSMRTRASKSKSQRVTSRGKLMAKLQNIRDAAAAAAAASASESDDSDEPGNAGTSTEEEESDEEEHMASQTCECVCVCATRV